MFICRHRVLGLQIQVHVTAGGGGGDWRVMKLPLTSSVEWVHWEPIGNIRVLGFFWEIVAMYLSFTLGKMYL